MSQAETALEIRRILLALDASPGSLAALDAAVELAAKIEAELSGVFVEDEELVRMAESPFARQILYPSATEGTVTRASVEREMKSQSERARRALEEAAQKAHVRWSFRTVRGQVTRELANAAGTGDVLAVGRVSWHEARSAHRVGSTAFELAASNVPLLLVVRQAPRPTFRVAVYYDGSPSGTRALLTAAQFARAAAGSAVVLLAAPDASGEAALRENAEALLKPTGLAIRYRRIASAGEASLLDALRAERPGMLIMASRAPFRKRESLEKLLAEIDTPVLWLSDEFEPAQ